MTVPYTATGRQPSFTPIRAALQSPAEVTPNPSDEDLRNLIIAKDREIADLKRILEAQEEALEAAHMERQRILDLVRTMALRIEEVG